MRWFNDQMQDGVSVRDLGDDICGFALIGPNSQFVLQKVAEGDVSKMRFMDCKRLDVGLIQSRVARMSVTGEMGFELNCKMGDHIALRRILLEAGADHDIREVGFNAMLSTRIEKSFGIWSAEFTQDREQEQDELLLETNLEIFYSNVYIKLKFQINLIQ